MQIQNTPSNQTFGCKLNTLSVLESTTGKYLSNGNEIERLKLVKNVLEIGPKNMATLKDNPLGMYLSFISTGKILLDKNPKLAKIIENLNETIKNDKIGEITDIHVKKIIRTLGNEIDLKI